MIRRIAVAILTWLALTSAATPQGGELPANTLWGNPGAGRDYGSPIIPGGDLTFGAGNFTFNAVNGNVGTFGSATQGVTVTVNGKGLITAISGVTITPAWASITGTPGGVIYALSQTNVSGSSTTFTGTINSGSNALTLNNAGDWTNGEGIRCNQAGANAASAGTAGQSVVTVGAAGGTTYTYAVFGIDANGGVGASGGNFSVATGNAALNATNYNSLTWSAAAGAVGYAIYGRVAGSLTFLALVPGTTFFDQGQSFPTPPDWLPSAVPANAGFPQWLVSNVVSGAGTVNLVLGNNAGNSITSKFCRHDDTVALNAAILTAVTTGQGLYLNQPSNGPAQYWVSSALNATGGSYGLTMFMQNSSTGTAIMSSSACKDTLLLSNALRHYIHDINISFPGGSFQTCGALVHNSGGIGSSYANMHLIGGSTCVQNAGGTFWDDHTDASCSTNIFSLTTPGDSTITRGYLSPFGIPGATNGVGVNVSGDPGGLRISNSKIIGNGASTSSMQIGIQAVASIPDGDFFVSNISIENFSTYGVLFATAGSTNFGNVVVAGSEIVCNATAGCIAVAMQSISGSISNVSISGNPQISGSIGVQIAGPTTNFTIQGGNIAASQAITVAAAAIGCVIGSNTYNSAAPLSDLSGTCRGQPGQVGGTVTNDNACAGCVGEYLTASASGIAQVSGAATDITSKSLTSGDWDCTGDIATNTGGNITGGNAWISTTSVTDPTFPNGGAYYTANVPAGANVRINVGTIRISTATTTTVFLSTNFSYTVSNTDSALIRCRRMR
jgi:hypothetical protein